jgi:hypothetical protein
VAQLFWSIGFFIFVGVSHVCSSHRTHGVFYLALVRGRPVLVEWCCLGFVPIISVLARFLLINRAAVFFLINEKVKLLACFKQNKEMIHTSTT